MIPSRPVRNPHVLVKDLGKESLLYSSEGKAIHVLNGTARFIWDLCDGDKNAADMERALRQKFAVPPQQNVAQDVHKILELLAGKGLFQTDGD